MEGGLADSKSVPEIPMVSNGATKGGLASGTGHTHAMIPIAHRSTFSLCPFPFSRISGAR